MSKQLKVRPSDLMGLQDDSYTAFCVDEVATYMLIKAENDEYPTYEDDESNELSTIEDVLAFMGGG